MRLGTVRGAVILVGYVAGLPVYVLAQQESVAGCPTFFSPYLVQFGVVISNRHPGRGVAEGHYGGSFPRNYLIVTRYKLLKHGSAALLNVLSECNQPHHNRCVVRKRGSLKIRACLRQACLVSAKGPS